MKPIDGQVLPIEALVPGGILETDHLHVGTNDSTCSRCRAQIGDDEVPLMLWPSENDLYIYCNRCTEDSP